MEYCASCYKHLLGRKRSAALPCSCLSAASSRAGSIAVCLCTAVVNQGFCVSSPFSSAAPPPPRAAPHDDGQILGAAFPVFSPGGICYDDPSQTDTNVAHLYIYSCEMFFVKSHLQKTRIVKIFSSPKPVIFIGHTLAFFLPSA